MGGSATIFNRQPIDSSGHAGVRDEISQLVVVLHAVDQSLFVDPRRGKLFQCEEPVIQLPQRQPESLGRVLSNDDVRLINQVGFLWREVDRLVLNLRHRKRLYNKDPRKSILFKLLSEDGFLRFQLRDQDRTLAVGQFIKIFFSEVRLNHRFSLRRRKPGVVEQDEQIFLLGHRHPQILCIWVVIFKEG